MIYYLIWFVTNQVRFKKYNQIMHFFQTKHSYLAQQNLRSFCMKVHPKKSYLPPPFTYSKNRNIIPDIYP